MPQNSGYARAFLDRKRWLSSMARVGKSLRPRQFPATDAQGEGGWPDWVAYQPGLLPPPSLMEDEGIDVLEEWFRWAEEWSMLLRIYGHMGTRSSVLEIGCGSGRIAFPLRYLLREGQYSGFDIRRGPIDFLQDKFTAAHPNFRFHFADLKNTHYNPRGRLTTTEYRIPAEDRSIDVVYAASVFTHMLPENTLHYFKETARVLRPEGRCVFSFFLLDNYRPAALRPFGFSRPDFNFDHRLAPWGEEFAVVAPADPERMTSYRLALVHRLAREAGMVPEGTPVAGHWSGSAEVPVAAQDIVVLRPAGL